MPLHVFLVQSLSLLTGGIEIWKLGKDLLLLASTVFTICLVWKIRNRGDLWWFHRLLILSVAYAALHALVWALHPDIYRDSALLGFIYNYRLFGFLFLGMGAVLLLGSRLNLPLLIKVVLGVSTGVAVFGVVQYFLPHDFMEHFGYGTHRGTLPAFFIDNRPDFPRVMSTLRDPNSLGAYLMLPITLLVALLLRPRTRKHLLLAAMLVVHSAALLLTFSRGAWAATLLSVSVLVGWKYAHQIGRFVRRWWPALAASAIVLAGTAFVFRETYFFKSVVTHRTGEPVGVEHDSNGLHWEFAKNGLEGIVRYPFGHGPGTAGLASIQNPAGSFLTENYYIQIGYEVGVLGLLLFLLLGGLIYWLLWQRRDNMMAAVLVSTFWGYVVMNVLFHMWSNEAVAAQWWVLAGMAIALPAVGAHDKTARAAVGTKKNPAKKSAAGVAFDHRK
jgi:hypothetical protein